MDSAELLRQFAKVRVHSVPTPMEPLKQFLQQKSYTVTDIAFFQLFCLPSCEIFSSKVIRSTKSLDLISKSRLVFDFFLSKC
jgi:hypothetical protein